MATKSFRDWIEELLCARNPSQPQGEESPQRKTEEEERLAAELEAILKRVRLEELDDLDPERFAAALQNLQRRLQGRAGLEEARAILAVEIERLRRWW